MANSLSTKGIARKLKQSAAQIKAATTFKVASASTTANNTTTYADIAGLSVTVVPGTYKFRLVLPSTVASGTGGIKYCFKYTGTVLSTLESAAKGFTTAAVANQRVTSTTDQADLFTQAAVVTQTEIEGVFVVTTGGTVKVQVAQNTANASNTVALANGVFELNQVA